MLLMGVDYNSCTFFHAIELALPVPYMGMTPKPDAKLRLPSGEVVPAGCSVHLPTRDYDFNRIAALMDSEELTRTVVCGGSVLRMFAAAPGFERVLAELSHDPYALTRVAQARTRIQLGVGKG